MMSNGRVLIVDDMADARTLLRLLLTHKGHFTVLEAENGHDGLNQARSERPDLIVLDYMMPDLNGVEVCQALRGDPATACIPIIMLTARTDTRTQYEADSAGVDVFLTKPIKTDALLSESQRLIGNGAAAAAC
jgi:two-component system cell cycle response regulator